VSPSRQRGGQGPRRLVVSAHKGGVGKTTLAVNLAAAMAETHKATTLLVDVDPQGAATAALGLEPSGPGLYDVLMREDSVADAIMSTDVANLDVLPANLDLAGAEIALPRHPEWQTCLREVLLATNDHYDLVVIDSAPGLGVLPFAALVAGDQVLIAATPSYLSLRGLPHLIETVAQAKQFNPALQILGIVPSMVGRRTLHQDEVLAELEKRWPGWSLPHLPRRVAIEDATAAGQPITSYAPTSTSATAVRLLAREVLARASA